MGRVRSFVARHYGITQIIVVVVGIETYELLRHAMTPNWEIAERHAQDVVSWERSMHIEWEEGLQQTFLRLPELVRAMNVFYFVGHFVLTGIFFFWLYHTYRDGFRRFRNGFLVATSSPSSSTGASRPLRRASRAWGSRTRSARSRTSTSARRRRRRSRTRSPPCPRSTRGGRWGWESGLSCYARPSSWRARRRRLSDRWSCSRSWPRATTSCFDALAGMLVMARLLVVGFRRRSLGATSRALPKPFRAHANAARGYN